MVIYMATTRVCYLFRHSSNQNTEAAVLLKVDNIIKSHTSLNFRDKFRHLRDCSGDDPDNLTRSGLEINPRVL